MSKGYLTWSDLNIFEKFSMSYIEPNKTLLLIANSSFIPLLISISHLSETFNKIGMIVFMILMLILIPIYTISIFFSSNGSINTKRIRECSDGFGHDEDSFVNFIKNEHYNEYHYFSLYGIMEVGMHGDPRMVIRGSIKGETIASSPLIVNFNIGDSFTKEELIKIRDKFENLTENGTPEKDALKYVADHYIEPIITLQRL